MPYFQELKKSLLISFWFMLLTFPVMGIRIDSMNDTIVWRWMNIVYVGGGIFLLMQALFFLQKIRGSFASQRGSDKKSEKVESGSFIHRILANPAQRKFFLLFIGTGLLLYPLLVNDYQINIMVMALLYVMLGLGLNIVVGMAGLLDLGFVAFYAVGAYSYALLNTHFGIGFWMALPIGGLFGALSGALLGFPILRLRGDYLAIVTLGFGEIIRLILQNWTDLTNGPGGIANISPPGFFGMEIPSEFAPLYLYYIMVFFAVLTVFVVNRLQDSRLGRAWIALREDEIACQSMGIDKRNTKLAAFYLGAFWAGLAGVIFAAQNRYINPESFTFLESAMILAIVVLGGLGSIVGVILGALILILLPEYLRELSEYKQLAFGAILVVMMVFRPQGLISTLRRSYDIDKFKKKEQSALGEEK